MTKPSIPTPAPDPGPGADFQPAEQIIISTVDQLKAISDPLRLDIIMLIAHEALTVKQMAGRLDQPPTKLYYHVAELEKAGFVTMVDTRVKSGIIEKYYRISAENITIDRKLLNASGDLENVIPDLLTVIFDTTTQEISRSLASGLVNLDDVSGGESPAMILLHSLFNIRKEDLPKFLDKFRALLVELDAAGKKPGPDTVSYGCTIAFYPRITPDNEGQE